MGGIPLCTGEKLLEGDHVEQGQSFPEDAVDYPKEKYYYKKGCHVGDPFE
jgi:hypothetical protein